MPPRNMGAGTSEPYNSTSQQYSSEDRVVHVGDNYFNSGVAGSYTTPSKKPSSSDYLGQYRDPNEAGYSQDFRNRAALVRSPPAKNLIAQYEIMTPPPADAGVLRSKSTRQRQYVYDYRTGPGYSNHLKTPERSDRRRLPNEVPVGLKDKERSPLRQSIRNLFSVLKKGVTKKKSADGVVSASHSSQIEAQMDIFGTRMDDIPMAAPKEKPRKPSHHLPPSQPKSGTLLHLSHDVELEGLPIPSSSRRISWNCYSAVLQTDSVNGRLSKLVLSSFTGGIQLETRKISLAGCVDVRSLSASQLTEDEAKRLDEMSVKLEGEPGRLNVFEVKFPGSKARERFAAKSVKERAGWISAIWDAVLPGMERQRSTYSNYQAVEVSTPSNTRSPPLAANTNIQSPIPRPIPEMSVLLNPSFSQRSLPPVPIDTTEGPTEDPVTHSKESRKPNLHLEIPPLPALSSVVSPSIYPPTTASSTSSADFPPHTSTRIASGTAVPPLLNESTNSASSGAPVAISTSTYPATSRPPSNFGTSSPCASPSVMNLTQLSMVRQRLAQIERNHSEMSAKSSNGFSPAVSRPGTPATPSKRDPVRSPLASPSAMSTVSTLPTPRPPRTKSPFTALPVTRRRSTRRPSERKPDVDRSETPRSPLREQLTRLDLHDNLRSQDFVDISKKVDEIKGVLGGESGYPTIHQVALGIENRTRKDSKALKAVHEKLDHLGTQVLTVVATSKSVQETLASGSKPDADVEFQKGVRKAVEDVKTILSAEFPALSTKLRSIETTQQKLLARGEDKVVELRNLASKAAPSNPETNNTQTILDRLEELKGLLTQTAEKGGTNSPAINSDIVEHLATIQSQLQEDNGKQALLSQQQADSVRYLNELNNWLETFVNNGTAQIQGLSINIHQLCRSLGCAPQPVEGGATAPSVEDETPNLLSDIRQLVEGMQSRDQNFVALQTAVHALLDVLSASQQQMGTESAAIAGLITRQRQEQEALLRTFTNEIAGEIRGERLRFVEAMKEATAINVQFHVENFKQELGREVMAMTEEVGHLHRQKQQVENQISDLFAFYSKHKQENPLKSIALNVEPSVPRQHPHQHQEHPRSKLPRASNHRPLPYPQR